MKTNRIENYIRMRQNNNKWRNAMDEKHKYRYDTENNINDMMEIKAYIDSKFTELENKIVIEVVNKATGEIEKIIDSIKNLGK